ncbi:MAG: CvpA family protein [Caldimonas sp.]
MAWAGVGWVDWAMLAVVILSAFVGTLRGFTFEVLSLAGWVAAWFAGIWLGPLLAPHLPIGSPGSALNSLVSFACAFLVVLILWGMAAQAVSAFVAKTLLRPVDRLLGAAFGVVRAAVVLLVIATVVERTPLVAAPAWRASSGALWLNAILGELAPLVAPARDASPARRV